MQKLLTSSAVDDETTLATIADVESKYGYLLDPHSAVGVRASLDHLEPGIPTMTMATAHPAKFADAIRAATGHEPPIPPALAGLDKLPRHIENLPGTLAAVQGFIAKSLS